MWLWWRKGRRVRRAPKVIMVPNVYGLGDGSLLVLAAEPDLTRLLADPNPVPPQASDRSDWTGRASIRFALVIGYLAHPDSRVRVRAVELGVQHCGHTYGFQDQLVSLSADVDPAVRLAAVDALWTVQIETHCEQAVKALRDEIRGHRNDFDTARTATLRLGPARAQAVLDLLVRHAPDEPARAALLALIDAYVVLPE